MNPKQAPISDLASLTLSGVVGTFISPGAPPEAWERGISRVSLLQLTGISALGRSSLNSDPNEPSLMWLLTQEP
jgi:hypothetical protein